MALFQRQNEDAESKAKESAEKVAESTPMSAGDPLATAAGVSVLYAWYTFYIKGDTEKGIFVGLWAPTLLAAGSYLQQKDIVRKFKQGFSSF